MFTKSFKLAHEVFFGLNDKTKCIPLHYNPKTHTITPTKDKYKMLVWIVMTFISVSFTMYLTGRFLLAMFVSGAEIQPAVQTMFYILAWLLCVVECAMNLTLYLMLEEFCMLHTSIIQSDKIFRAEMMELIKRKLHRPTFVDFAGWILCCFPVYSTFIAITAASFTVFSPLGQLRHAASEILPDWMAQHFLFKLVAFTGAYSYSLFATLPFGYFCLIGLLYVRSTNFELTQLVEILPVYCGHMKSRKNTEEREKIQKAVVHWFQCMRILNASMNLCIRYLFPVALAGGFSAVLILNYGTIKLYDELPLQIYLVFPLCVILLTALELELFLRGTEMNKISYDVVNTWTALGDKYMAKACKAFRPLRLRVGPFFFFTQGTALAFFNALICYTVNLLLSI